MDAFSVSQALLHPTQGVGDCDGLLRQDLHRPQRVGEDGPRPGGRRPDRIVFQRPDRPSLGVTNQRLQGT